MPIVRRMPFCCSRKISGWVRANCGKLTLAVSLSVGSSWRRHRRCRDAGRVDEVGLALVLAGAEVGQEAVGGIEGDAGAGEADAFAVEEAELAAGEGFGVDDGAEATGGAVAGIVVAGGVERGDAEAEPVVVARESFDGGELGIDAGGAAGGLVEVVGAPSLVESVSDVGATDVAVAGPACVVGVNAVGDGVADGRGSDEKAVVVVVGVAVVANEVVAELRGVAPDAEVLDVDMLPRATSRPRQLPRRC